MSCEPGEKRDYYAPPPAILELVHDKDAKDDVHNDVPVTVMHEHGCDELVKVFLIMFNLLYVEDPII